MLKNVYGEVIIPKDSILYHTTDIDYDENKDTSFLFCTFHPSEWWNLNEFVLKVRLKRDVRLLFMIKDFRKAHIISFDDLRLKYTLQENILDENFDGWFSSIENRTTIEITLKNKQNIYEIIGKEILLNNWINRNFRNNILADFYKISSIEYPLIFNINQRYEEKIRHYLEYCSKFGFINNFTFQVILDNAIINYHKCDLQEDDY